MPDKEVEAMFEVEGNQASIRPHGRTRESHGSPDASDPEVVRVWDLRTWCWQTGFCAIWNPEAAEMCLRNIERLVKPGGHLFGSGIDLDLLRQVHEGDVSPEERLALGMVCAGSVLPRPARLADSLCFRLPDRPWP